MKKNKQQNITSSDDSEEVKQEQEEIKIERIGIMFNKFLETISYGHQSPLKHVKQWHRGQVVWNESDIEKLIELNAPILVYFRYVD